MRLKKCLITLICVCLMVSVCSCSDKAESGIYYITDADVATLDPQLASTKAELAYAYACFDRLYSYDKNGNLVKGNQVSEFSVSDDGLTYTFTISDGFYWSDQETPITAEDYAYGINRALSSETKAPYAGLLSSVKEITASENILTLKLKSEDDNIKYALAHPVSAPCNSSFFNGTKGKYGLENSKILTNGAFYVRSWSADDNSLTLRRSENYSASDKPFISYVKVNYGADGEELTASAKEDTYNIYSADADVFREYTVGLENTIDYYDTTYCLYLSDNMRSGSVNIAKMLICDIDKQSFSINLPDYCRSVDSIVPSGLLADGRSYSDYVGALKLPSYSKSEALKIRGNDSGTFDFMSGITLYYPDCIAAKTYASLLAQTWQRDLNAYINPSPYSESELLDILFSDEKPVLAIIPVRSADFTADGVLSYLSGIGVCSGQDGQSVIAYQQSLINDNRLYPLFEMSSRYLLDKKITAVSFIPYSGTVDLRHVDKTD